MKKRYTFNVSGVGEDDKTWAVAGTIHCEWADTFQVIMEKTFHDLTNGRAVYGEPGVGCNGPYSVDHLTIQVSTMAEGRLREPEQM